MIQKIVKDTGGLHNRITRRIFLKPFTLAETELYFKSRNILTLVSTFGITHNEHSLGLIDQVLTIDDIFLD